MSPLANPSEPVARLLEAVGDYAPEGDGWLAHCPGHADSKPSLRISQGDGGRVLFACRAGCSPERVVRALGIGMADLFQPGKAKRRTPTRKAVARPSRALAVVNALSDAEVAVAAREAKRLFPKSSFAGYKLAALYPYRRADGSVWCWRWRFEHATEDKEIGPFHFDGVQWLAKEPKAPRAGKPLYRLPELLATEGPVFVVEGEKCADALAACGITSTTSGGSGTAKGANWAPLAGRQCVIWPDNDDSGDQYAAVVAAKLAALGCSVSTVDVQAIGIADKGADVADWLTANPTATTADLLTLPTIAVPEDSGVTLVRASDIEPRAINWLWEGWLACGMLTLIAGNGGTGKTTIALSLAATITTGGGLPDGTRAPRGSVIIWSGEDALAEVLLPRLQEAGADTSRIHFITAGADGNVFDPATDMPDLERAARQLKDLALIIVDPIVSAVSGDSHKNAEVRRGLQPLLKLAADTGAAIIGITHYAKNTAGRSTAERVIGSVAFNAVARVTLATAMGQDGEGRLVRAKNNIGATGDGFAYSIAVVDRKIDHKLSQVSKIEWGRQLYGFADELLGQIESRRLPKDEAAEWLMAALHGGPVASMDLKNKATADGIAWRTVERAKDALGVTAQRHTEAGQPRGKGAWVWRLPPTKHL